MRHLYRVIVALAFVSTASAAEPVWQTPGAEEADAARRLSAAGRCNDALENYDRAIETRSEDATLRRDRGLCHEQLDHPAPAIADYEAYLAMAPEAPDVAVIGNRLDALRGKQAPAQSPVRPGAPAAGAAPQTRDVAPTDDAVPVAGATGWMVGLSVGARTWAMGGYAQPTSAVGPTVGWAPHPHWQLLGELTLVNTNIQQTSGFGLGFGAAYRFQLDAEKRFEVVAAGLLALESQSNNFRVTRRYVHGRLSPSFRWIAGGSVVVDFGPDVTIGSMDVAALTDEAFAQPSSSEVTTGFGGHAALMWLIGP